MLIIVVSYESMIRFSQKLLCTDIQIQRIEVIMYP